MIVRLSFIVAAFAVLLIVNAVAMAGGMPSDEGPDVVLDEQDIEALFTPTITTIIERELPQYIEASAVEPGAIEPGAIEPGAIDIEAIAPTIEFSKLPPAFDCPKYGCGHDL
jgi:hypothetical protein